VIIPTYNRLPFLKGTIRSVLAQRYDDFELFVVADGHQPDVEDFIRSLGDTRATYMYIEHCGFPARPRNTGVRASQAEYIAFCDDDDLWHPDKLAEQVRMMQQQKCGLCFTGIDFIDENDEPMEQKYEFRERYRTLRRDDFLLSLGFITNSSVMLRREVVEKAGFLDEDPNLRAVEDYQYWSRVLKYYSACYVDKPLVRYRIHTGSIQPVDGWKWLKKQLYLHRSITHAGGIPAGVRVVKTAKIMIYALRLMMKKALGGRS
jgi:glycosyltransferase involved in cell wall biosynthesis